MPPVFDVDWITFDCYGTLIDWDLGLRNFLARLLVNKRVSVPPEEVIKAWEPIQYRMVQQPYRRYREILARSLEETLRHFKVSVDPEDGAKFATAMGSWRPFKDVPAGLARLRRKYKLGILTNTDKDIIHRTLAHFGVPFDLVLTAEEVRAYKPSPKGFAQLLEKVGVPANRVMHAAFGIKYDLGPSTNAGMRSCLVKRGPVPRKLTPQPNLEVTDLGALADAMEA